MKSIVKIIGSAVGIVLVLFGLVYVNNLRDGRSFGSIQDGQAYTSSTTDSTYASSQRSFKGGAPTGSTGLFPGTLGSIIVTGTSATVVEIKDATSTTDLGSTTLAVFAASPATGTYTFDTAFTRGLRVNFLGSFAGKYTITWR